MSMARKFRGVVAMKLNKKDKFAIVYAAVWSISNMVAFGYFGEKAGIYVNLVFMFVLAGMVIAPKD